MIEFLNMLGEKWASYFGIATMQNTLFLGVVLIILYRLKHASAKMKYMIAAIGLLKLFIPPFIPSHFLPSSATSIISVPEVTTTLILSPITAGTVTAAPAGFPFSLPALLFLLWLAVVIGYILFCLVSTLRFAQLLRSAEQIANDSFHVPPSLTHIKILKSSAIDMPLTLGIYPKSIFVPESWDQWNDECRRVVLMHEAAHIQRHDSVAQTLQIFVQAIYFFHPLVWLLNRRLREYREMACDDVSVNSQSTSRLKYSRYLVEIAESVFRNPVPCKSASALIKRRNELLNRVRYQLRGGPMNTLSKCILPLIIAGLIVLMLPLSWYFNSASSKATGDQKLPRTARSAPYVDLAVNDEQQVVIDGTTVSYERYIDELRKIYQTKGENTVIKLICDDDVSMSLINRIQRQLIDAGLTKVEFRNGSESRMPLALPSNKIAKRMKEIPENQIVHIHVRAAGSISWNKTKIDPGDLGEKMQEALSNDNSIIVSLHTDDDTTYGDFLIVLQDLKQAGANRIFINIPSN